MRIFIQIIILIFSLKKVNLHLILNATNEVVSRVCEARDVSASLILPESEKTSLKYLDKINELVTKLFADGRCRIRVDFTGKDREEGMKYRRFFVIVINEIDDIFELLAKKSSNIFTYRKLLVFSVFNGDDESIKKISELVWMKKILNIILIYPKTQNSTSIATFLPFQEKSCHTATFKVINEYENGQFVEPVQEFFPEKFKNLRNCPLRLSTGLDASPCVFEKKLKNGTSIPGGSDIEVVTALSQKLNFEINYNFRNTQGFLENTGKADGEIMKNI